MKYEEDEELKKAAKKTAAGLDPAIKHAKKRESYSGPDKDTYDTLEKMVNRKVGEDPDKATTRSGAEVVYESMGNKTSDQKTFERRTRYDGSRVMKPTPGETDKTGLRPGTKHPYKSHFAKKRKGGR